MVNQPITAICMVSLRYHDEGFIDTFDRQIRALNEVQECYHMAGKVDFFLKINMTSLDNYHEFVRSKLSKIEKGKYTVVLISDQRTYVKDFII